MMRSRWAVVVKSGSTTKPPFGTPAKDSIERSMSATVSMGRGTRSIARDGATASAAGLAGMAEVTAIQGRLVAELSPGYGFVGFLVSWLARTTAGGIFAMSFLFAVISSIGDILQITQ